MLPQIFVKPLQGKTITMSIDLNITTNDFKKQVFKQLNMKPNPFYRFSSSGKYLNDGYTLHDLNVVNSSTIQITSPLVDLRFSKKCLPGNESLLED
jgi:hypothetical protein